MYFIRPSLANAALDAICSLVFNPFPRSVSICVPPWLNFSASPSPSSSPRFFPGSPSSGKFERDDDHLDLVRKKLKIFRERTQPLLDYYGERGATIIPLAIGVDTQPGDLVGDIRAAM